MIISKISVNSSSNCKPRQITNKNVITPTFGLHKTIKKPIIQNDCGNALFQTTLKYIKLIPEHAKMSQPKFISVLENNVNKVYGILVDKSSQPNAVKVVIKDTTKQENWNKIADTKDSLTAIFDNKSGRMISGDYDGIHFYRTDNTRDRKITIGDSRYAPDYYSSNNWELTTYGTISNKLDKTTHDKETLGSIFWAMTTQDASINAK